MKRIVCDASPLIVMAKSGLLSVLTKLVDDVIIPETVYAECTVDMSLPGAQAIRAAVETGQIQVQPDAKGPSDDPGEDLAGLDAGELAAIRLASALQCSLLVDERLARQVAKRKGITVIGSAALLIAAKQRGLVPAIAPILDHWRQSGYFLSASLVKALLDRAGET